MIYSPVSFDFARQIKGDKPVVVQFYTTWDGPSKAISPIFEKYSTEYGENVDFYRIDTDEVSEIVQEVGIRTVVWHESHHTACRPLLTVSRVPAFIAFREGETVGNLRGANPPALHVRVNFSCWFCEWVLIEMIETCGRVAIDFVRCAEVWTCGT
ncbi:thioredoxin-like protein [Pterulicium gracile]|uniref:Thioredoxin-like protein n=1 Tax=Pterulicium gracile TaxID=1884261 RepID=A0A5C3R5Z3_9AGAR|nr:thioredoxin-like protein [Pterula gracilis]